MEFQIKLFIREHRTDFYSVEVLGDSELKLFTDNLEAAREDLQLVISDRVERTHPRAQSHFSVNQDQEYSELQLPDALVMEGAYGPTRAATRVSVLGQKRRNWRSLYIPKLDLYLWLPGREVEWERELKALVDKHLARLSESDRLRARYERKAWVEDLPIEAEPPPLSAFSGKYRDRMLLPLPAEEQAAKEDEEEETPKHSKKKQKRPPTPTLKKVGTPLSKLAEKGELDRAFMRKREVAELHAQLSAKGHQAIVVVGPSGVGKSTILNELVYKLRSPESSDRLRERAVWFADANRLVATDGWFGDWQRQTLDVIEECDRAEVVWYLGALLPLLDAGKSISSDQNVSQLLKPYLASRRLTVIGECTQSAWAQLELRDPGFSRLFSPYRVEEAPKEEAQQILAQVGAELQRVEDVQISDDGLAAVTDLTRRYVAEGSALGTAIHFLRRTVEKAAAEGRSSLSRHQVVQYFSLETGLPERLLRDDVSISADEVLSEFSGRLIGQNEAVRRMTDLVAVIKAGLSDLSRPLGSFLFVGPTGVGKTEMAKALANYLFGDDGRLLRFDMSEYVTFDAVHRFLGDKQTEGKLVEGVRRRPFSVVLLDEIEKANPAIFDVLLQVLGEARLTDESGRTADFRNAVVIMTSNLGVESFKSRVGFSQGDQSEAFRKHFLAQAEQFFRPEFFNRIDHIIPFVPLQADAIAKITKREVNKFLSREGLRQRHLELTLQPEVYDWLAERGVEPKYGARPLKRVLERSLSIPLARFISKRAAAELSVSVQNEALEFDALSEKTRSGAAQTERAPVLDLIDRVDRLRFRMSRWTKSRNYVEAAQSVRLLEQLSQNPSFWKDRALAERRSASVEPKRIVTEGFQSVKTQLASLEDLAYEAYSTRSQESLTMMEEDLKDAAQRLDQLELDLYEQRFDSPGTGTLYLVPARGSERFANDLVEIYGELARLFGWKMTGYIGLRQSPPKKPKPAPKTNPNKSDNKSDNRAKADKRMDKEPPKDKGRANWAFKWRGVGALPMEVEEGQEAPVEIWQWMRNKKFELADDGALVLSFEGPHAAGLLAFESGTHYEVQANESFQVQVSYINRALSSTSQLKHPRDLPVVPVRRRTLHHRKRILEDHLLKYHVALEPRVWRLYRSLIRGAVYHAMFGPEGVRLFRKLLR